MDALEKLFAEQAQRIIARKFHINANLRESEFTHRYLTPLEQLLRKYELKTERRENRIPICIVIPHNIVPLSYQLHCIRESLHEKPLEHIMKPEWFENAKGVSTPNLPYLLLDVETGYAMRNIPPKKCVEAFTKEGRFPLTIDEGLALVTHFPEVLESHWIDLPGSELIHKYAGQDAQQRGTLGALPPGFSLTTLVATLYYKYYETLRLYYVYDMNETPYSGSASCASRLSP